MTIFSIKELLSKTTKIILLMVFCCLFFDSCRTAKNKKTKQEDTNFNERDRKISLLLETAYSYKGTKYKLGGTDKNGMDCSGLVITSFNKVGIQLPRTSKEQSDIGTPVKLKEAAVGDLIYFATSGKSKGINHVGIITYVDDDNFIYFIHSSIKSGIVQDNMTELYYQNCFVKVMRVF